MAQAFRPAKWGLMKSVLLCLAAAVSAMANSGADASLEILPASAELTTPESHQHFLAEATVDGYQQDWTTKAQWSSSNPQVARIDAGGEVSPAGDGEAVITAKVNGLSATATVKVRGSHAPFTWSFRNNVIPVMTKVGCNQGACHGALAGKHGFKLTLRGYAPEVDYDTLTREAEGRRVSLTDPAASLILLKPTFTIPHGGGKRFSTNSLEFRILSEWIAEGAPPPSPKDPVVTGLEVFPKAATLKKGDTQQLVVRAKYSDGHVEDVTHWVKYSSSNAGTASADDNGLVKMNGSGEAAVTLWYSSRVLYSRMTTPYPNQVSAEAYAQFPRRNYIDDYVVAKLKTLHIQPSPVADDATFLRRAYLDAAGILPTPAEAEAFLADKSPGKRQKLIDTLLERDEFVDYWAYKWSDLLLINSKLLKPDEMWSFYRWIRESVRQNKPWDKFALEIFTGSGDTRSNGALNYYVLHKNPIDLAETSTEAFMGQRVTCARCHNHPLEKWTQTQYYSFANLFARVGVKNGNSPGDVVVFAKTSGDVDHPRLARPLPPAPLDGQAIPLDSPIDRRLVFAKWLVNKDNPYFARNLVNRVWANFYGRGLVNPPDDLRSTNPASNEELLAAVSKDFVDHGYDVKYLIRTIMNSGTYQLSAESNATNQNDDIFYSKYIVRRLPAEVILDVLSEVTGVPSVFPGYPAGTRAMQLPDSKVPSPFLNTFGRPLRDVCDSSERTSDPTVGQALSIINGDTLNKKLSAPEGTLALLQKIALSNARIVEHLYLSAYTRYPTEQEEQELVTALNKASAVKGTPAMQQEAQREALQDMLWAMLTSKEFMFNH
jgi:hypothetical protein